MSGRSVRLGTLAALSGCVLGAGGCWLFGSFSGLTSSDAGKPGADATPEAGAQDATAQSIDAGFTCGTGSCTKETQVCCYMNGAHTCISADADTSQCGQALECNVTSDCPGVDLCCGAVDRGGNNGSLKSSRCISSDDCPCIGATDASKLCLCSANGQASQCPTNHVCQAWNGKVIFACMPVDAG